MFALYQPEEEIVHLEKLVNLLDFDDCAFALQFSLSVI